MIICFMCDLHLCSNRDVLQYKVLDFAIDDIIKKRADCMVYAGDVTCDGNGDVYKWFISRMSGIGIPFLYIPGNSDLRDARFRDELKLLCSSCVNRFSNQTVFAINDCDRCVSENDIQELESADAGSIVFLHHPITSLTEPSCQRMLEWRSRHPETMVFYGHKHISKISGHDIALQAMDPDKAIGENPCITYYNTETKEISRSYYLSKVPADLHKHFGISCYDVERDIEFAIENKLKNLELRNSSVDADLEKLTRLIEKWRELGGEDLSLHLPEVTYLDGNGVVSENLDKYVELCNAIGVNRLTQHVPKVSVKTVRTESGVLEKIAESLSLYLDKIDHDVTVGVENMHMTAGEAADENRRFGYIPEECLEFMEILSKKCRHNIGINFDIGHARNNLPFSQTYQIGTWMVMLGKHIVGYHLHQVNSDDTGEIKNHLAITDIYGRLISLSSFFCNWTDGVINKAPVIFEMRPKDAYRQTLDTFNRYKI